MMRVILADDHRIVREGIRWMLAGEDIEVVGEADSGHALLELLDRTPADLVLLDVRMPGMDGLEALERLRDVAPQTRVIVLSMHDEPAYVRRAVELGARGYLLKHATREELLLALHVVAEGRAYVQGELVGALIEQAAGTSAPAALPHITRRESDILQLAADGLSNTAIAGKLGISEATVKSHFKGIFEGLDACSRAEAVAIGLRLGIIE
jgi:DNA-binding NarL/FixJ family response regulator